MGSLLEPGKELVDMAQVFIDFVFVGQQVGAGPEVFQNGHLLERPPSFGAVDQAHLGDLVGRRFFDALAHELHRALKGDVAVASAVDALFPGHQAGGGPQGRGFAGAVGAYEAHQLSLFDTQTDVVDNHRLVVTDRQIGYFQHRYISPLPR